MIDVEVLNCNNITSANIHLRKDYLNIRYAMNGIGKSTIAAAISMFSKDENLSALRAFGSEIEPTCKLPETVDTVLLFNEEFVKTIVFQQSEVIQNSFEIFIKTTAYEERQNAIDKRLKNLRVEINQNADLQRIVSVGRNVLDKFQLTQSGALRKSSRLKSLTSSESIFKLPDELKNFQPLMDKEYKVEWVGWKNDGSKYDDNQICPFCTSEFDDDYENEKKLFSASYTKSNVRNILEMLSYFDDVRDYMDEDCKDELYQCIQHTTGEKETTLWVKRFYDELKFLVDKISDVVSFNSYQVRSEDISHLDEQLRKLLIGPSILKIFNNEKAKNLVDFINDNIGAVLAETASLKIDIGQLESLVVSATKAAIKDINEFLITAGISYKFDIVPNSENTSKTILSYISRNQDLIEVEDIDLHLSWGEKNAFALVLFMHHALSQNPELIILDDPISSFDSNKKYAIINRLFSGKKSFSKRTVLMLTHDLQPIIDFTINSKPSREFTSAYFLQNKEGIVSEHEISAEDVKSLPILLAENSKNDNLNRIHRIASLRKLLEHTPSTGGVAHGCAYNLLSCLLHGRTKPAHKDGTELTGEEIRAGEKFIKQYIADFDYGSYSQDIFTEEYLLKSFCEEDNSYIRLQIFRVILSVLNLRSRVNDDPLLKYIDEQFHVENDYMFSLDFMKYDIVPEFIIPKCIDYLKKEDLIP